jgi:hypothetical protein
MHCPVLLSPASRKDRIGRPLASNPDQQSFDSPLIHDRDSANRWIVLQSPCRIETNVDRHFLEIDVLNLQAADLNQTRTCAGAGLTAMKAHAARPRRTPGRRLRTDADPGFMAATITTAIPSTPLRLSRAWQGRDALGSPKPTRR